MLSLNSAPNVLGELFFNPKEILVDSPLISTDRIDETQVCLTQFGQIRVYLSDETLEPYLEKIVNWSQNNAQNCAYFFKPNWKRQEGIDPFKVPQYTVYLTGWALHKGGVELSKEQNAAVLKSIDGIRACFQSPMSLLI